MSGGGGAGVTSAVAFKWLDLLEKEFDKSYVGLDQHLAAALRRQEGGGDGSGAEDAAIEAYEAQRKLLSNMAQCFVQLSHKSQTIAQTNAKLEAELIHCREEMSKAKANLTRADSEKNYLIVCLQSALLENHKLKNFRVNSVELSSQQEDSICSKIQMRLASEMAAIQKVDWEAKRTTEARCQSLEQDLEHARRVRTELESELVGARLDAKYLDKELAGRIQQIQILLAANTTQEHKQKVWSQIETEMHLQRSKTISNMCYSKQKVRETAAASRPPPPPDGAMAEGVNGFNGNESAAGVDPSEEEEEDKASSCANPTATSQKNRLKQVHLHKHDSDELGMAILGGKEHGLPIMISEIFPDSSVSRSKKIAAGDVILAVNGDSFEDISHNEAVRYLSSLRGTIIFDLENTIEADIDKVCDMDSRYYDFFQPEEEVRGNNKPRPEEVSSQSNTQLKSGGKAENGRNAGTAGKNGSVTASAAVSSCSAKISSDILPQVHSSPTKKVSAASNDS